MNEIYEKAKKCYESISEKINFKPKVAIVLGSGLGNYADDIQVEAELDYSEIEDFPISTVPGHAGKFIFGYVKGIPVVCAKNAISALDTCHFDTQDGAEFFAALTFARKKKLGAFFIARRLDEKENMKKSLGTFARSGFSYDIAQKVLDMSLEEIEDSFRASSST